MIYGPDGKALTEKIAEDAEGLLIAELDLGLIGVSKNAIDPVGHYSRPDVTRLLFNQRPSRCVENFSLPADMLEAQEPECGSAA